MDRLSRPSLFKLAVREARLIGARMRFHDIVVKRYNARAAHVQDSADLHPRVGHRFYSREEFRTEALQSCGEVWKKLQHGEQRVSQQIPRLPEMLYWYGFPRNLRKFIPDIDPAGRWFIVGIPENQGLSLSGIGTTIGENLQIAEVLMSLSQSGYRSYSDLERGDVVKAFQRAEPVIGSIPLCHDNVPSDTMMLIADLRTTLAAVILENS